MFKKILLIALLSLNLSSLCFATPLCDAAENGNLDEVRRLVLVEGADVNAQDQFGNTPLQLAADQGYDAVVQFLIANAADVDVQSHNGATASHYAAINGHIDVVISLLNAGADLTLIFEGQTVFQVATPAVQAEIIHWQQEEQEQLLLFNLQLLFHLQPLFHLQIQRLQH